MHVLESIHTLPTYKNELQLLQVVPARSPSYAPLAVDLAEPVVQLLRDRGMSQLYSHQAEALRHVLEENAHVLVTTSTSSGKSLIYQLATLQALTRDRSIRVMYISPTKALAQDQHRAFQSLVENQPGFDLIVVRLCKTHNLLFFFFLSSRFPLQTSSVPLYILRL
jgi:DEAD/DEAH box helicase domain-containing protein